MFKPKKNDLILSLLALSTAHFLTKILYSIWTRRRQTKSIKHLPGLRGHWLLGFAPDLLKNMYRYQDWINDIVQGNKLSVIYPPIFANTVHVYTHDPVVIKHILKDNLDFYIKPDPKRDILFAYFFVCFGKGIFTTSHGPYAPDQGAAWKQIRKTTSKIFTRDNFKDLMTKTFIQKSKVFVEQLNSNVGKPFDMQQNLFAFTMDSIMKIFFGRETSTLTGNLDTLSNTCDVSHLSLVKFLFSNMGHLALMDILPYPFGPLIPGHVNGNLSQLYSYINPEARKLRQAVKIQKELTFDILRQKMSDPDLQTQSDLAALFLNAQDENGESYAQEKHIPFLFDTLMTLILAGRDTTACTLTWLFFILSTNPKIQQKLCEEIDEKLQGRDPTDDDMAANFMPYLNGVVYETLRVYPAAHEDFKVVCRDDTLPDGTKLAEGTKILYHPYGMGRDPERYEDPLTIKPERWIPFVKPSDYEFPNFQAGPRICLGMNMSLLETKIFVVTVLQKYTFTIVEGEAEKVRPSMMLTMSLSNSPTQDSFNLWLIPHPRNVSK